MIIIYGRELDRKCEPCMKLYQLSLLFVCLACASLFVGVQDLSLLQLFHLSDEQMNTLFSSRIPRLMSIVLAGMSLSLCGFIMQSMTRNKFVSPTTAGTMDWAKLGILTAMLVFTQASPLMKMAIAFLFTLAGNLLFLKILRHIKVNDTIYVPLVGLMFGGIVSSISTFIAYKYDLIQNVSAWLQGDFSLIVQGRYELLYVSVPLLIIAYLYADRFTVAALKKQAKELKKNGLVIMANDSKMTAFGSKSRYGLIHDVFGITPADQKLEPSDKHGQSISYEYMVKTNPDYLFVVDRGAAIGEETSAKQLVENDYVKSVKAVKNNHVVYLNSDMWYLAGGGLESLNAMIDEVKKGIEQ